jgi:hypothetical protein
MNEKTERANEREREVDIMEKNEQRIHQSCCGSAYSFERDEIGCSLTRRKLQSSIEQSF